MKPMTKVALIGGVGLLAVGGLALAMGGTASAATNPAPTPSPTPNLPPPPAAPPPPLPTGAAPSPGQGNTPPIPTLPPSFPGLLGLNPTGFQTSFPRGSLVQAMWVADSSGSVTKAAQISGTVLGNSAGGFQVLITGVSDAFNLGAASNGIAVGSIITVPMSGLLILTQ